MKDMSIEDPPSTTKRKKKANVTACVRKIAPLLKDVERDWEKIIPGLLTELSVHKKLLTRIQHQFRSSKIVQRSQSVQSCARRLLSLRSLDLQVTARKFSFSEGVPLVLSRVSHARALIAQLATYAQLVAEGSTQALAQEHYFFFGSDISILATSSRIWTISRLLLDKIDKFDSSMRLAVHEFGSLKKKSRKSSDGSENLNTATCKKTNIKSKKSVVREISVVCNVASSGTPLCKSGGVLSRFSCPEIIDVR